MFLCQTISPVDASLASIKVWALSITLIKMLDPSHTRPYSSKKGLEELVIKNVEAGKLEGGD